ncbi:hypothetical protein SLA2020_443410 [Shorea laevis]
MLPQPIFSSTFLCIITIFSILLLLPPSYSDLLDEFIKCNLSASFQCGNHGTFYYPFWNDNTPEHCRPLGFHLKDCEKEVPTVDFGPNSSFQLQHRNPSNYSKLTIAPVNLAAFICPVTTQHRTLLPLPLKFSETNQNLTLFYSCTPPYGVPPGNKIDCGPNENNKPFFFMHDLGEPETDDSYGCSTVKVAVNENVFNEAQEGELTSFDALRQFPFDVEYNCNAVFCHQYENLGGKCGKNSTLDQYLQTTCQDRPGPGPGMDYLCKTICF